MEYVVIIDLKYLYGYCSGGDTELARYANVWQVFQEALEKQTRSDLN